MTPDDVLERVHWDLFWMPPETSVVDRPELLVTAHPSKRPELNVAARVRATRAELPALIDEIRALHVERLSTVLVVPGGGPHLRPALEAAGYAAEFEGAAFTVDVDRWTPRATRFHARRVQTLRELTDCVRVKEAVFEQAVRREPADLALELSQCTGPHARVHRYVVYDGDRPVSSGGMNLFPGLDFGFLWAGGTVPDARGKGAYSELVAARIRDARALGFTRVGLYAKLQTSAPIVAKQGFVRSGPMAYLRREHA